MLIKNIHFTEIHDMMILISNYMILLGVFHIKTQTRHVFVNMDAPGGNKVKIWQKSLSPTF